MKKLTYLLLLSLLPFCSCGGNEITDNKIKEQDTVTATPKDTTSYTHQYNIRLEQGLKRIIRIHSGRIKPDKMSMCIYDITDHTYIFRHQEDELMAPASCIKLVTAVTALDRMGKNYHFTDSLFMKGNIDEMGTLHGSLILKMDDDPLFWDFYEWSKAVKARGIKRVEGNIIMNLARRDTLRPHPTDKPWDIQYHKLPLMLKGEKFIKRTFIYALAGRGIKVKEQPFVTDDPTLNEYWTSVIKENEGDNSFDLNQMMQEIALSNLTNGAECIASRQNNILKVISPMLIYSSNIKAESMFYHLDNVYSNIWKRHTQYGRSPHEVEKFLKDKLGIDMEQSGYVICDGSGLSPANRLSSAFFVNLLLWTYNNPEIREILINESLACPGVPGRKGSLKDRMATGYAKGRIFCKTGTLVTIGGSSLSGYAKGRNGHWYAFSIIHKDTPVWNARDFQDAICRELVR